MTHMLSADIDPAEIDNQLADLMAELYADPLQHVIISYPWNEGTLHGFHGPDVWAAGFLKEWGQEIKLRGFDGVTAVDPIQFSVSSGHGIGKSAMSSWIIKFIMDTRPFCKGVVTSNTAPQLKTKTWSELAKWNAMSLTKHWFMYNNSHGNMTMYHKEHKDTWRVDAQTCAENNSESFAGLHSASSTPFYLFDEASNIPDVIYEVREGGLTDGEPMTFDFGNPTRSSGRFYENMEGRFRHRFIRKKIDSRSVKITNKKKIQTWIDDYGIDSDFVKVRVLGEFPSSGSLQFMPASYVDNCVGLDVSVHTQDPLVMGVDVARFGDDQSVIWLRQGRDAESPGLFKYRNVDTMTLASEVSRIALEKRPDAIMIDGGGVGGGVVDRCRQLGLDVIEVNFGGKATQRGYANMRAQMWGNLRDAMKDGIRLPDDPDIKSDLTGLEYGYTMNNDIKLEKKEDMKRRGLASPDLGDALALTYAMPVFPSRVGYHGSQDDAQYDYDPFE
tara:strand:+ start:365 stop:1864 length:1500 start_codon:yes stop_codon:yes gene_type:complete